MNGTITWPSYLTKGAPRVIYHMCDGAALEEGIKDGKEYFPPTYAQDGFVHASAFPKDLLAIGNNFYKNVKGDWVCFSMNPLMLDGEVKYELAAPVGNISSNDTTGQPKFPHIYGGIPGRAIIRVHKINRSDTGEFLSIDGLC